MQRQRRWLPSKVSPARPHDHLTVLWRTRLDTHNPVAAHARGVGGMIANGVLSPNIARDIWRRLEPHVARGGMRLHAVRVYETPDLFVDYFGEAAETCSA